MMKTIRNSSVLALGLVAVLCVYAAAGAPRQVWIPVNIEGHPGQVVDVPIMIDDATGVQGFNLRLTYDPDILQLSDAGDLSPGTANPLWTNFYGNFDIPGDVSVVGFDALPLLGGNGSILDIGFHVPTSVVSGTSPVTVGLLIDPIGGGGLNEGAIAMVSSPGSVVIVPEPASVLLLLAGALVTAVVLFRRGIRR
jgi:hypothetical protein